MRRHQLPVTSPIGLGEVGAAFRAATFGHPAVRREALEREIARVLEAEQAMLTDSGTSALTLALRAAVPVGGAVALPGYGCYDLATACDGAGVTAILYDVEPETLGPDLESLERALGGGACAVVTAPPYGFTRGVQRVREMCDAHGVPMIEDVAQCLWAETGVGPAGTLGDFVVLSFGRGKGVTAGRGGAIVTRRRAEFPLGVQRRHAWSEAALLLALWTFGRPALFGIPASVPALGLGQTVYRAPEEPGLMSDVGVAVLARTWAAAPGEVEQRRRNAGRILDMLTGRDRVAPCRPSDGSIPSYLRLPAVVDVPLRTAAEAPEARRLGIMPGYPRALRDLAGFGARCRVDPAGCQGAATLARGLITFPTHSKLTDADFGRLAAWCARNRSPSTRNA
jgi:dTDP-4-amino-4,6-dideoxygalactose transaminase